MLEILLSAGTGLVLKDSGPGSWVIEQGTQQYGWFGEVDTGELFTPGSLLASLQLEWAPNSDATFTWFKAVIDDTVVFWPNLSITASGVTYKDLFEQGLVYGKSEGYSVPSGMIDPLNKQIRIVSARDYNGRWWYFKVRLFSGYPVDPFTTPPNQTLLAESEWNRLWNKIIAYPSNGQENTWASYAVSFTQAGWVNISNRTGNYFGQRQARERNLLSYGTSASAWLPILELVNPEDYLLGPQQLHVSGLNVQPMAPATTTPQDHLRASPLYFQPLEAQAPVATLQSDSGVLRVGPATFMPNPLGAAFTVQ